MQPDYLSFFPFFFSRHTLGGFVRPHPQAAAGLLKTTFPSQQTSPNLLLKEDLVLLFSSQFSQKQNEEIISGFKA